MRTYSFASTGRGSLNRFAAVLAASAVAFALSSATPAQAQTSAQRLLVWNLVGDDGTMLSIKCGAMPDVVGIGAEVSFTLPVGKSFKPRGIDLAWLMMDFDKGADAPLVSVVRPAKSAYEGAPNGNEKRNARVPFPTLLIERLMYRSKVVIVWEPKQGEKVRSTINVTSLNTSVDVIKRSCGFGDGSGGGPMASGATGGAGKTGARAATGRQ
jgi:hypothetical protein